MKIIDSGMFWLILLVIFFLGFQLYYLPNEAVTNDETLYAWYVHLLRENPSNFFSPELWQFHPPLLPAMATLLWGLDPLTSMRVVSIFFGAWGIFLIGLIGRKYAGEWAGLTAATIVGLQSFFVGFAHFGLLDTALVVAACLIGLGWLTWNENTIHAKWLMILGIFLAIFSKRSGFMVVGVWIMGMIIFRFLPLPSQARATHLKSHARELFLCVIVGLFAWFFSSIFDRGLFSFYDYSAGIFSILLHNLPALGLVITWWVAVLFFIGYFDIKIFLEKERVFLMGWVGVFGLALFFPYFDARYFFPALPPIGLLAALGASRVCNYFSIPKWIPIIGIIFLLAPGIISIGNSFSHATTEIGYSDAGGWLAAHAQDGVIYDSLEREVRYYSGFELQQWGGPIIKYPESSGAFLDALPKHTKPVYAVVANWPNAFGPYYPTDEFIRSHGFTLVHSIERVIDNKPASVVRIYRYT